MNKFILVFISFIIFIACDKNTALKEVVRKENGEDKENIYNIDFQIEKLSNS
jgi:hypothetical protein